MSDRPEHEERLWWLGISPGLWVLHLLTSYATVAVWCAKVVGRDAGLGSARLLVVGYTVVALIGIVFTGRHALRRHRYGTGTAPHDFDTAEDRHRFLGFATLLLSIVSFVGVIFVALPLVFIETCR